MQSTPLLRKILYNWLSASLALFVVDGLFDSVWFDGLSSLLLASALLVVMNMTLKPVLLLVSLPFIAATMGLFVPLINGFVLFVVAEMLDGFHLSGYWMAVFCAIVFSLVSMLISLATGQRRVVYRRASGDDSSDPPRGGPGRARRPSAKNDDIIDVEVREKKDD